MRNHLWRIALWQKICLDPRQSLAHQHIAITALFSLWALDAQRCVQNIESALFCCEILCPPVWKCLIQLWTDIVTRVTEVVTAGRNMCRYNVTATWWTMKILDSRWGLTSSHRFVKHRDKHPSTTAREAPLYKNCAARLQAGEISGTGINMNHLPGVQTALRENAGGISNVPGTAQLKH